MQTAPDDGGPESVLHFVTRLVPLNSSGREIVELAVEEPGSLDLITPVRVPFSFDPAPETPLIEGAVAVDVASATGIFTGEDPVELFGSDQADVSIERDTDFNIFRVSFVDGFERLTLGRVAEARLTEEFVLADVTARVLFDDGHSYGLLELNYR